MVPGFEYVEYNNLVALQELVLKINTEGVSRGARVAGIMMEALQGEGGIRPGNTEFFKGIRKICDETGALMVRQSTIVIAEMKYFALIRRINNASDRGRSADGHWAHRTNVGV